MVYAGRAVRLMAKLDSDGVAPSCDPAATCAPGERPSNEQWLVKQKMFVSKEIHRLQRELEMLEAI